VCHRTHRYDGSREATSQTSHAKDNTVLIVGVPREIYPDERRVGLVPTVVPHLRKAGLDVVIEAGAGVQAGYPDAQYVAQGAQVLPDRSAVFSAADVIVQVLCYGSNDITGEADLPLLRREKVLIGFLRPLGSLAMIQQIAATGVTAFAVELIPRTTRAQSMDALSSMGTICGYKAALMAADTLPKFFPMLTTAAGTITPARVFVIGAGVAGLQAIATARRLGAVASAYDMRPAAKEQVQSLGGRFIELPIEAQDARGYGTAQDEAFYQRQRALLSARTKIFLYVKISSTFADSQPSLFTMLINKKGMLTSAIYPKFTSRNSQLAPQNLSRESTSSCSTTCSLYSAELPRHQYDRIDGDLPR
jgi:NAD/NADP transhydrogenase alpha subunit